MNPGAQRDSFEDVRILGELREQLRQRFALAETLPDGLLRSPVSSPTSRFASR